MYISKLIWDSNSDGNPPIGSWSTLDYFSIDEGFFGTGRTNFIDSFQATKFVQVINFIVFDIVAKFQFLMKNGSIGQFSKNKI